MGNKLELTWLGKENEIKIEPRILIEDKEKSNCTNDQNTENMIIHGDNLLALKALESKYAGQVKCIYIDPPYNTGSAFEHYDDNLEHSTWLSLMKPRLEILRNLLSDDGSIWISIDDEEMAYLKILMDELFGRLNYFGCLPRITKKGGKSTNTISKNHDYILFYAKNYNGININQLEIDNNDYPFKDKYFDERGSYKLNQTLDYSSIQYSPSLDYPIEIENRIFTPGNVSENEMEERKTNNPKRDFCWRWSRELVDFGIKNEFIVVKGSRLYTKTYTNSKITKNGDSYVIEYFQRGKNSTSLDFVDNIFSNDNSRKDIEKIFGYKAFDYSKPESLIQRILTLNTNENDLVLDSFLGSGTTAAVAHKMGRKYIGIEMGDHAYTHCKVRLDKVIDGSDQGGISKAVGWQGGGAYKFYELAPSLINKDDFDEFVINKEYDANMLASAVALHEGFTYEPDEHIFWKQSKGNESSYLFVTTRHLNAAYLDSINLLWETESI